MSRQTRLLAGYVVAVWAMSGLVSAGTIARTTLAASPRAVAGGRVWLLVTSGVFVDRPVLVSLLSLSAFALATGCICGARTTIRAGLYGHVLSTLLVYAAIAVMRIEQPYAFASVLSRADFGVSAVCAAWLGAIAATVWRARPAGARAGVVGGCTAVTACAYALHPDHSIIASEHVFAFLAGVAVASPEVRTAVLPALRRGLIEPWANARLDPVLGVVLATVATVGAVAVAPTALATVGFLLADPPATIVRCISTWNGSPTAPRGEVGLRHPAYATITLAVRQERGRTFRDCSLVFYGGDATVVVRGRWSHGRVRAWHVRLERRPPTPPANARVHPSARLTRLDVSLHR